MTLTLLIASPLEPEHVARLAAEAGGDVRIEYHPELLPRPRYVGDHNGVRPDLTPAEAARWRDLLATADVMFDFDWMDPARLRESAPRLRWVQASSSGIGEFLRTHGLAGSDIAFTTAAGLHARSLAEFVILSLLYFFRDVPAMRRTQAAHHWERITNRELTGAQVLIVGLGEVGRAVAAMCAQFGMEVWATRRTASESPLPAGVARVLPLASFREALPQTDCLVLCCPLTETTRNLIGAAELRALPPRAILVNIARGAVVDEPALVAALTEGRLAGAALDVFATEPLPPDNPLWDLPNVLVSPHSASTVFQENGRLVDLLLDNLARFRAGRPLRNRFDAERGY
jgi:phosphoglycerate dehydrogenase-like enzyme